MYLISFDKIIFWKVHDLVMLAQASIRIKNFRFSCQVKPDYPEITRQNKFVTPSKMSVFFFFFLRARFVNKGEKRLVKLNFECKISKAPSSSAQYHFLTILGAVV